MGLHCTLPGCCPLVIPVTHDMAVVGEHSQLQNSENGETCFRRRRRQRSGPVVQRMPHQQAPTNARLVAPSKRRRGPYTSLCKCRPVSLHSRKRLTASARLHTFVHRQRPPTATTRSKSSHYVRDPAVAALTRPCASIQAATSAPPALRHRCLFQGKPCWRAHCRTSRWPPFAAT